MSEERSRWRAAYAIRAVTTQDAAAVAKLIRTVMPEFGASGPGYAIMDPEVDDMHASYSAHGTRAAYWVVVRKEDSAVVGGGGFAQAPYQRNGFVRISCAKGATGHSGCDTYYERVLA